MKYIDFYIEGDSIEWMTDLNDKIYSCKSRTESRIYDDIFNVFENNFSRISTIQSLHSFIESIEKIGMENFVENPIVRILLEKQSNSTFRTDYTPSDFKLNNSGTTFNFSYNLEMPPNFAFPLKINEWINYSNRYSITVKKKVNTDDEASFKSWDKIEELSHPSKDFIIIDNYICSSYNLDNLFSIIKELFSNVDISNNLNFLIVTSKLYSKNRTKEEEVELLEVYKRIKLFIEKLNFNNVNLSIVKIDTSENHDRHIFTNYFVFKSGNSFNFIDSKTGKIRLHSLTDFDIIPLTSFNNEETYAGYYSRNHFKEIKKIIDNSNETNCIGNKVNRLLEFV